MNAPAIHDTSSLQPFDLFHEADRLRVEELHIASEKESQLRAIIAIHNTRLGPALGGCRCVAYPSTNAAILDAMRLARGMSYKAAITGLPFGGGKAVAMRPDVIKDRDAYFGAFGAFVEKLGGRYITAEDSGTNVSDMNIVEKRTRHVLGTSMGAGDPSPHTAFGVLRGMEASIKFWLKRQSLERIHVAIQGVGHVGYHLAKLLSERDARLTVTDVDNNAATRCADECGAAVVSPEAIYSVQCDVFAPCALGGVINQYTVARLDASIIAGSANNQLADPRYVQVLMEKGILYAPDYVVNAGGLIQICVQDENLRTRKLWGIYDTLTEILERAGKSKNTGLDVADQIAESIIYGRNHSTREGSSAAVA